MQCLPYSVLHHIHQIYSNSECVVAQLLAFPTSFTSFFKTGINHYYYCVLFNPQATLGYISWCSYRCYILILSLTELVINCIIGVLDIA